jgi:SAM-dependent MidA family methyltransferase
MNVLQEETGITGTISFARYMELALYHPQWGYYRRPRSPFGTGGDFYTAEQLQPVFGEIVASHTEQLAETDPAGDFQVLELGAGRSEMQPAFARWGYRAFDWSFPQLPDCWTGLVFANEFFDALPVHLLQRTVSGWKELRVAVAGSDELRFVSTSVANPDLLAYAEAFGGNIPEGGKLEVCLAVQDWFSKIHNFLCAGNVLVIDYGYEAPRELVRFPEGSLVSYRQHRAFNNVLQNPGEQDITAHVNFSWLRECARTTGFELEFCVTLRQWMLEVWPEKELQRRWKMADERWRLQCKQLLFGLGETFNVLQFRRT